MKTPRPHFKRFLTMLEKVRSEITVLEDRRRKFMVFVESFQFVKSGIISERFRL